MERCPWCQGSLDPATQRCQQCGRLLVEAHRQAVPTGPDATYLQLGLGRGASYLDLDLEIGPGQQGVYPLLVLRSPAGAATGQLRWPFAVLEFQQTLLELQNALLRASQPHRQVLSPEAQAVQRFGQRLFDALFTGEVRQRYQLSQREAAQHGCGLRLRLHLLAPDLAVVPWEYLYDPEQGDYLCLSRTTPIVRYLERQEARQPLPVTFPLRLLVLIASPSDQEALDTQSEQQRVEAALRRLRERGLVELVWLKGHTWRDLQRAMRGGPWHIFHFIGHGGFDRQADEGVLALENEEGKTQLLRATELARLLATQQSLRLVLLNACEGARASIHDRFSSTAATLARRDIPAVVAMQYAISDRAATEWTRAFYEAVADGLPMDAAVAEARTAISLAVPHTLEWGTPVLYLQAPDGVLFRLPEPSRPLPATPGQTREPGLAEAEAAQPAGRVQEERAAVDKARRRAPNDPATAQGNAAVFQTFEPAATPPVASPAAAPPAPAAPEPTPPAPSTSPAQNTPPAQRMTPPEQGAAQLPTLTSPPSPEQATPAAQAAYTPIGAVAPRVPTPVSPSSKRSSVHVALVALLLLVVLVSGSLGVLGLTGHGPLALPGNPPLHPPGSTNVMVTPHPAGIITEFPVPTPTSEPAGITTGPDGNLWFTEFNSSKIGRITLAGKFTEFPLPTANSYPYGITAGPDGNLWFTELHRGTIGRITPAGTLTEFALEIVPGGVIGITVGPDGNLWFTESAPSKIGRITPTGTITEFPLPTAERLSEPESITTGPDGNLWFTEGDGTQIGRITPTGTITEFPLPSADNKVTRGITAGPDGNLWFTELFTRGGQIGRITPTGTITEFPLPSADNNFTYEITTGPEGNLWFTEGYRNQIGRITPTGTITEFPLPTGANSFPEDITTGPDSNLWFTEENGNKIGRITSGR